jgi:hypothetical protein
MITDNEFIENLNTELGEKTFDRNSVYCLFEPYVKNKEALKTLSVLILFLAGLTLTRTIVDLIVSGLPIANVADGMTKELMQITAIITVVLSCVLLLPQVYVGIKGIKVSNGAASSKAPFVWAIILAILSGIAAISGFSTMISAFTFSNILAFVDIALDVVVYIFYCVLFRKIVLSK